MPRPSPHCIVQTQRITTSQYEVRKMAKSLLRLERGGEGGVCEGLTKMMISQLGHLDI